MTTKYPLGHRQQKDIRDKRFSIPLSSAPLTLETEKYWDNNGWWGDQGNRPACVGFAWRHWLMDGPIPQKKKTIWAIRIYKQAQRIDEWPGTDYDGTSIRAGAKVLKKRGYISEYLWAFNLQAVIQTLLTTGPMVVGTNWHNSMYYPNKKTGILSISGSIDGGHAYLLNGVNTKTKLFRLKNSWGRNWGLNGEAYISFDDFDKLLTNGGTACIATEIQKT